MSDGAVGGAPLRDEGSEARPQRVAAAGAPAADGSTLGDPYFAAPLLCGAPGRLACSAEPGGEATIVTVREPLPEKSFNPAWCPRLLRHQQDPSASWASRPWHIHGTSAAVRASSWRTENTR